MTKDTPKRRPTPAQHKLDSTPHYRGGNSLEREAKRAAPRSKLRIQAPNNCKHCGRTISFGAGGAHHRNARCSPRAPQHAL